VHRPLAQQGEDRGTDVAASGPSCATSLAVVRSRVPGSTAGSAVVVSTAIAVDLGCAALAAGVVMHVRCLSGISMQAD
jgi:hypothetical protein